jgi:transaldolase
MDLKKEINFSLWCDFIERSFLDDGFLKLLDKKLIHGATSNPAIFKSAIISSSAYSQQINMLQANEPKKIYEELSCLDIKKASNILKPLYDLDENDGFISLEVDPFFCDDANATFEEGVRLHQKISCENLMIKVPATTAGFEAMQKLTAMGISVNATLIFSPQQAILSAKALNNGIKESQKNTKAVISVFVSRFDRLLDEKLISLGLKDATLGIINATKCYHEIKKIKNKNIRTLFASTGVKGDKLPQSYYIDNLIFPNTINTAPLDAIDAWEKDGQKIASEILSEEKCDKYFKKLKKKNINMKLVYDELLEDGLQSFKSSFDHLLEQVKL